MSGPGSPVLLQPAWPPQAGPKDVAAAFSTRAGGSSTGCWASLNLGGACGDDAGHVAANRAAFARSLGASPVWLRQVHGTTVLRLDAASPGAALPEADAAWTSERGIACTVLVADCLPLLLAARDGSAVAAVHAGWRGLAAGVLPATLRALQQDAGLAPQALCAWLGPCIGPQVFEVGADVLQAFGQAPQAADPRLFQPRPRADGAMRWLADLPALAAAQLQAAGVPAAAIALSGRCTFSDASAFFSFRRDGLTGRMAAAIWRL